MPRRREYLCVVKNGKTTVVSKADSYSAGKVLRQDAVRVARKKCDTISSFLDDNKENVKLVSTKNVTAVYIVRVDIEEVA